MNTRFLLLALSVAAFSSCSSVYKSGQTPDDVYYSPAKQMAPAGNNDDEYVNVRQQKPGTNYQTYEQYQDSYRDDRFLRMSVGNPYYMNYYNGYGGFDWRYNSYYNGFNYGFTSPWNNYFAWNSFYNPYSIGFGSYYGGGYGYSGGYYAGGYGGSGTKYTNYVTPISRPRVFNVNSYTTNKSARSYTPVNGSYYNNSNGNNNRYNNSNNNSYYNNSNNNNNRSTYTPSNNNNNSYTPTRSYTPSSGGGGSSSSGGGGGGSVSRPTRGN